MHTGRNSFSNLALSTQSCPLKLGKKFSPAHKFPNFVLGHTASFGCSTSRKTEDSKCVSFTSIHFAPRQVRFNINQSKYIIKTKLKVSSKFGKNQICMKLKATLIQLQNWSSGGCTAACFLNTAFPPNQNPGLKAQLFRPPQVLSPPSPSPFRSDLPSSIFLWGNAAHSSTVLHSYVAGRFQ